MQLTCPNCGERIRAEHINVQKMVAVCSVCDTVFRFNMSDADAKAKRRKVKQPQPLALRDEDDTLHMDFRTNFRLDRDESFILDTAGGIFATILSVILMTEYVAGGGDIPLFVPLGAGLAAVLLYSFIGFRIFSRTHIDMDDEKILISRKPIQSPLNPIREVNLAGVAAIRCEETAISIKEAYDTPRYRVWAEMANGSRKVIVNDVIDDYGYFIAQRLQERLHIDSDLDISRLEDVEDSIEGEETVNAADDVVSASLKA
ncbi:MAG: hypothetical protein Q9P01_12880 [Anaerolineae bacterium]|nr:hypothetical protein [Anaerolineae bacterium]MDQ7035686.1 hypothetical protein [Anaerolineae bacterium]